MPDIKHIRIEGLAEEIAAQRKLRFADCERYNDALNMLELAPNGDDYNALIDMLRGAGYRDPDPDGR